MWPSRATTIAFQMRKMPFTTVQTSTNKHTTSSVRNGVVGIQRWAAGAIQSEARRPACCRLVVMLDTSPISCAILGSSVVGRQLLQVLPAAR